MNPSRQLLRYTIPGGVFVLVAAVLIGVRRWVEVPVSGKSQETIATLHQPLKDLAGEALAAIAAAVIFGFMIYQIYYVLYRPIILHRWARFDRGAEIIKKLKKKDQRWIADVYGLKCGADGIPKFIELVTHKTKPIPWFRVWRLQRLNPTGTVKKETKAKLEKDYRKQWYRNATMVQSLTDMLGSNGADAVRSDYNTLSDVYHALGAIIIALWIAFVAAIVDVAAAHRMIVTGHPVRLAIGGGTLFAVAIVVTLICEHNRRDTLLTMTNQLAMDLRWWFNMHRHRRTTQWRMTHGALLDRHGAAETDGVTSQA
jgi:hypothetical protein